MSAELTLVEILQQIVREELRRLRFPEPAVVIGPAPSITAGGDNHYHCDVKLRRSGLELAGVPIATGRKGEVALPGVGDLVLVSFVGGDVNAPVVTGRLYAADDQVPEARPGEFVYVQPDPEEQGLRRFHCQLPNGTTLTADDEQIELETGGTRILVKRGGDVEIESQGKVSVRSSADMAISAGGNLAVTAQGDLSLESQTGRVDIKAVTGASLQGGPTAEVQGASLTLKGQTNFTPG